MWNLPRPDIELVSLALAGEFLSSVPPGKSHKLVFRLYEIPGVTILASSIFEDSYYWNKFFKSLINFYP